MEVIKLGSSLRAVLDREKTIFTGCNEVAELTRRVLDKLGIRYKVYAGFVRATYISKHLYPRPQGYAHIWIEFDSWLIETNPSQILNIPQSLIIIQKKLYPVNVSEREEIIERPLISLTSSGERFYEKLAEEVIEKMKDKILRQSVGRNRVLPSPFEGTPVGNGRNLKDGVRMGSEMLAEPTERLASDRITPEPYSPGPREWALLQQVKRELFG